MNSLFQYIRQDPKEWERLTREAMPLMDFLIPAVAARVDTGTGQGKTQVVRAGESLIEAFDPQELVAVFEEFRGWVRLSSDSGDPYAEGFGELCDPATDAADSEKGEARPAQRHEFRGELSPGPGVRPGEQVRFPQATAVRQQHPDDGFRDDLSMKTAVVNRYPLRRLDLEVIPARRRRYDPPELRRLREPFLQEGPDQNDFALVERSCKFFTVPADLYAYSFQGRLDEIRMLSREIEAGDVGMG